MQRPTLHPWRVDTLMLGTDYYLTESGIASLLAEGKVPIGNASLTRTLMEFQRIFELKGLKKADQQSILNDFNKHGPGFTEPSVSGAMPQVVPTHLHYRWTFFTWLKPGSSATAAGA
ncbi:hypothetical protein Bca101_038734 [Brassica carinata]